MDNYSYKAYYQDINLSIVKLTKEGVGIRSIARLLNISTTTLLSRVVLIAKNIKQPIIPKNKSYEVDEIEDSAELNANIYQKKRQTHLDSVCFGARNKKCCEF